MKDNSGNGTDRISRISTAGNNNTEGLLESVEEVVEHLAALDAEKRYDASEVIRNAVIEMRDAICQRLEVETDELALVSLLQTLQMLCIDTNVRTLVKRLAKKDPRTLVRVYAVAALGCGDSVSTTDSLVGMLATETDEEVRIQILFALYRLGYREVWPQIIRCMKTATDYHVQCAAIDGILSIDLGPRKAEVVDVLRSLATGENIAIAVSSAARGALDELSEV